MSTLRDELLPVFDELRGLIEEFGLRRYTLTVRQRTWSGGTAGAGTPTDVDTDILPSPKVRQLTPDEVAGSGGTYQNGDFKANRITPAYIDGITPGGFSPDDLKLTASSEAVEILYLLVGDDGTKVCTLVGDSFDRAFGYSLILRQTRRTP